MPNLPRLVPRLYLGVAHLALAGAFLTLALDPEGVAGFWYHPRMVFVVHLVVLGGVTTSILGAFYLAAHLELVPAIPVGRGDVGLFVLYVLGISGVVGHFWIDELSGVALSGVMVGLAIVQIGAKLLVAFASGRMPGGVKLHFVLAFANLGVAILFGIALAINKLVTFLPGYVLSNVAAHAHLAALGWLAMVIMGAAYHLLPVLVPAARPSTRIVLTGVSIFEAGVLGLALALVARSPWRPVAALTVALGLGIFLAHVGWQLGAHRRSTGGWPWPATLTVQALLAVGCLVIAVPLGLWLSVAPTTEAALRGVLVYGLLTLVGFLAQMVMVVGPGLLPLLGPRTLESRSWRAATLTGWVLGMPALAAGLLLDQITLIRLGATLLLAAVIAGAAINPAR